MKEYKYLAAGLVLLLMGTACNQPKNGDGYTVKGELKGVDAGRVKLINYNDEDRSSKTVDSASFSHGTFELKGKLDGPQMMSLIIQPGNWSIPVFVENGVITVKADTSGAQHYDQSKYGGDIGAMVKNFTISGSKSQAEYDSFNKEPERLKFKAAYEDLNKQFEAEKNPEAKEKIRPKFDSVGKLDKAWQLKWMDKFIGENPSSTAGVYIFKDYYTFNSQMPIGQLDSMLNRFTGQAKASVYYANLTKDAKGRRALLPGNVAPDFTLLKRDSTKLTLSSTRGKYVMLDFWASWCKPCREAIPHWKEVYQKYNAKGFEILSVSDDSRWADWIKAMDQEKMPWTQVVDEFPVKNMPAKVGSLYKTHFIPFYVLLDKEGKILVYSGDEKEIDAKLKTLFN